MISTITLNSTTVTSAQLIHFWVIILIIVMPLIVLLALKEIFSAEKNKNKKIQSFITGVNITIVPLLMVFVTIVFYKILEIIN